MEPEVGERSLSVMRAIKLSLDPLWLINPGKVYDSMLHLHQMESLGVTISELRQYARAMSETLIKMHYISEIDGNGIEFVLVSLSKNCFQMKSTVFGAHSMWVLDFELCRRVTVDAAGVVQAAAAFRCDDPYCTYPRSEKYPSLKNVFRERHIQVSEACGEPQAAESRCIPAKKRKEKESQILNFVY